MVYTYNGKYSPVLIAELIQKTGLAMYTLCASSVLNEFLWSDDEVYGSTRMRMAQILSHIIMLTIVKPHFIP